MTISRKELAHCCQDKLWGGCHHIASIFFAAMRPAPSMRLCWGESCRVESSLSSNKDGDNGILTLSISLRVIEPCLQKVDTSGQIQDPTVLSIHKSQLGDKTIFIAWCYLGVRYTLCINVKCINWWPWFLDVLCKLSHTVSIKALPVPQRWGPYPIYFLGAAAPEDQR